MEASSTRALILEAARRSIAEAPLGALLNVLNPKRLADEAKDLIFAEARLGVRPPSPATVAYHFHVEGTERQFDQAAMIDELLADACDEETRIECRAADRYLEAAAELARSGSPEQLLVALSAEQEQYQPGSTDHAADIRGRMILLATVACDTDGALARRLRGIDAVVDARFVEVYQRLLQVTGRRVAAGFDTQTIVAVMAMLLRGEAIRYRYGGSLPGDQVSAVVMRIFWAFTVPVDGPEVDVASELLGPLNAR